jgi:hypothetical protein
MPGRPIAICCCYASNDEPWYRELKTHLGLLLRQSRITLWHQGDIPPGDDRAMAIHDALAKAQVILLLVSANFFDCDECYKSQLPQAMARHRSRTAQIIPILLKPLADWQSAAFGPLQVLPMNKQPISAWSDRDAAWQEVVEGILRALEHPAQSSGAQAGSAPDAPLPPIWMVPYTRNPVFTGREEALARLTQQLQAGQTTALSQSQAISGLGGIGKTQLAVEYAYRHASEYQAVLWARAASRDTLQASFVEVAAALGLPQQDAQDPQIVINAVKAWLQTHSQWLLILDNADDLTVLPPFLPSVHKGHILITTREHTMRRLAQRIEIDMLAPEVGALFLLRRTGQLAPDAPLEQASPREQELAQQISRELGGLPLALDQAGAYIEDTNCGLAAFLPLYQQRRTELLNGRRTLLNDHPDSVATTVSLAVQRVEQRQPAAAELLRLPRPRRHPRRDFHTRRSSPGANPQPRRPRPLPLESGPGSPPHRLTGQTRPRADHPLPPPPRPGRPAGCHEHQRDPAMGRASSASHQRCLPQSGIRHLACLQALSPPRPGLLPSDRGRDGDPPRGRRLAAQAGLVSRRPWAVRVSRGSPAPRCADPRTAARPGSSRYCLQSEHSGAAL